MIQPPTPQQTALLRWIARFAARHGYPPSYRDMVGPAGRKGMSSLGSARYHVGRLERLRFLERDPKVSRGLRVTSLGLAHLDGMLGRGKP